MSEDLIAAQVLIRSLYVGIEIEDLPGALGDVDQSSPMRQVRTQQEVVRAGLRQFEHTWIPVNDYSPAVNVVGDALNSSNRCGGEIAQHGAPVERLLKRQSEHQTSVSD
jgi:hypothetical protein